MPTTFQAFTTTGSLKDFKQTADHEYVIGGVGDFLLVPENGELKADAPRTDRLPQRKLDTYGKQFSMTRQAFINDDIGFLTEVPGLYATAAKKTIDKQVYKLLFENKAIFDGKKFFSADHRNHITTGSKPSQASIQQIILKMQQQVDQFGEAIYITPRTIVVPVGYEFDLAVILHSTQVTGSNNNDINPLYNYPPADRPVSRAERPGGYRSLSLVHGGQQRQRPWHPGGLPERPGDPHRPPHGGTRHPGLRLGYVPRLGHQRPRLPRHRPERRRSPAHRLIGERSDRTWLPATPPTSSAVKPWTTPTARRPSSPPVP